MILRVPDRISRMRTVERADALIETRFGGWKFSNASAKSMRGQNRARKCLVPLYIRYRINENYPDFIRSRRIFHQTTQRGAQLQRARNKCT